MVSLNSFLEGVFEMRRFHFFDQMTHEQQALGLALIFLLCMIYHQLFLLFFSVCGRGLARVWNLIFLHTTKKFHVRSLRMGPVTLSDGARLMHTQLVGATGVGKTTFLEHLIQGDIQRGYSVIVIDPKGDRSFYERVREICRRCGRLDDLHLLSATYPEESSRWNPFRMGNAAELQAKFFNAQEWSEPFYKKACEAALLRAFNELVLEYPGGFTLNEFAQKLESLSKEQRETQKTSQIEGLFLDFYSLTEGPWAEILGTVSSTQTRRELNFLNVARKSEVLFIDLPTESQAVQSKRIGKILLQEIVLLSGLRKQYPALMGENPISVIIDEFDAFATESFATFLNKGRSSGFMITMAHQTLADLDQVSPAFKEQILGNPNIRIVFRQDTPTDAELWSKFFGTKTAIKSTFQTQNGEQTGTASNREVQEFHFHPDEIKRLGVGECIVSIKTEKITRKIQVPLPVLPTLKIPMLRAEMASVVASTSNANRQATFDPDADIRELLAQDQVMREEVQHES